MNSNHSKGRSKNSNYGKRAQSTHTVYRKALVKSTLISTITTFFEFFDFPIYWPLLLFYFLFMTLFLFRYKIEHMIKYKYIPFDFGKKKYNSASKSMFKTKN